jgi:O-antigen ligase
LRQLVSSQWFALTDLLLVMLSCGIWIINPRIGSWSVLIALLPWALRTIAGKFPFQRTLFDWLIAIFLLTAWVGYWASYDKTTAWNKAWLIVLAVLLYYALSSQPKQNLVWISFILFVIGVGVSIYYFLTYDFIAAPRKLEFVNRIGTLLMGIRPQTGWSPIHPNYVAGIVAVTVPFVLYPLWKLRQNKARPSPLLTLLVTAGLMLSSLALIMTTSRGVILAILSAAATWLLWKLFSSIKYDRLQSNKAAFSSLLLVYLCALVFFVYMGPAQPAGGVTGFSNYGNGSRAELFSRSSYLLLDFPFTGGGLGSFPGLYSQYVLNIPNYYLPNSHNLFLDVAIEQGVIGGLAFAVMYIVSLWKLSGSIASGRGEAEFQWLILFSLVIAIIHGMVDNYLYNGVGSMLSLLLVGLSMREMHHSNGQARYRLHPKFAGVSAAVLLLGTFANLNQIRSIWYSNLGAVQMSQVELSNFPTSKWATADLVPALESADASFRFALLYDNNNQTANYRIGMISMLRQDFEAASVNLETAYKMTPNHRGIVKSLGYCYVWLGDMDRAQILLSEIHEAAHELGNYDWWWREHGRDDLSANAALMSSRLESANLQP